MKRMPILVLLFFMISGSLAANDPKIVYVTAKSGLTLREKPGIKSKAITLIPTLSPVTRIKQTVIANDQERIERRTGNWVLVSYQEFKGYVFDGYLSSIQPDENNWFIGEYTSDLALSGNFYPSYLYLDRDSKFEMEVNLCHGFGTITGTWKTETNKQDTLVIANVTGSDFGLKEVGKIKIVFIKSAEGLSFDSIVSNKEDPMHIGCEFGKTLFLIKK
ncbi:SH3 domain-containing protein [Leptospira dzoumogneensis]|uniref:SH3 domain-containing protein n=1 Tax=Leptospira dzoumogneensis TaxID=2484904 RepID=A0A4Z1AH57_9LEPT|nr:SH3 domain-containing protein [Leptospira dzoumogneensis]TGN02811.1 SH3 domain-containing protein [Leptospira dzoumogneensis]